MFKMLRTKFPQAGEHDVEDVVGDAILDLCDYWCGLESSMTDDVNRNWNYANWRARKRAVVLMHKKLTTAYTELSLEALLEHDDPTDGAGGGGPNPSGTAKGTLRLGNIEKIRQRLHEGNDADIPTDEDYVNLIREFTKDIPEEEHASWLRSVLNGESTREAAEAAGVSHQAIMGRRERGKRRLVALAQKHGLRVVA